MEDSLGDRLNAAISNALSEDSDALVNKWVISLETVHENGRMCSYIASDGMMTWEVIGMSEATSELARAQLTLDYIELEDDDDDED